MTLKRLGELLFKGNAEDDAGRRAEIFITLSIGCVVAGAWAFVYGHPTVIALAAASSLTALFSLVQTVREKPAYPLIFPIAVTACVIAVSILEKKGVHDLIWISGLGVHLYLNSAIKKNTEAVLLAFGFLLAALFVGIGLLEVGGVLPNPFETDARYILVNSILLVGLLGAMTGVFHRQRTILRTLKEKRDKELHSSGQLADLNRELEKQVHERTHELRQANERLLLKTAKLQAASEVSQELIAMAQEPETEILSRATRAISDKLGYYHAGIFLLDRIRGYAVLQAANSKGGQQMLANRHQLKIGGAGIVSYVAQSGRPRIALDTGVDAVFFNNPYLPETRSEISLPVKLANSVLGVLDVQSTQSAAFDEEDTSILMNIANQIALILGHSSEQPDLTPQGRMRGMSPIPAKEIAAGYKFHPDGTITAHIPNENEMEQVLKRAVASGEITTGFRTAGDGRPVITVPVKFRDQVVGVIQVESEGSHHGWSDDEILLIQAISDRAALALENARLFEDATRRAEQEETVSKVTAQIGASTDFERILQTTVHELGIALGASRAFIQVGSTPANNAGGGA